MEQILCEKLESKTLRGSHYHFDKSTNLKMDRYKGKNKASSQ